MDKLHWWERRWFLAFLVLVSTVPLLWPETPPLGDLPAHMGRFRVQLDLASSPDLQRYFQFHWALVGNLGTDLLVQLLGPIIGLEPAVKLIVIAIPPLTVLGLILVAKEIHGRVPPTMMFAEPFVYSFTFNYGFLNFSLALALSLLAFALWLKLTVRNFLVARLFLFVPLSCALWIVHAFGWGILGLLAFSSELVRHQDRLKNWKRAYVRAALDVLPMTLPLLAMTIGDGSIVAGKTGGFFNWHMKLFAIVTALRDQWLIWDSFAVGAAVVLIASAIFDRHLELSRKLAIPAAVLALLFVLMPKQILGLSYADARLAPVMVILGLSAIRVCNSKTAESLALLGLVFIGMRIAGNTISFITYDHESRTLLTALQHIPKGAPVLFLTGEDCRATAEMPRFSHLGSMVIVRRNGFSNDQWQAAGAQLLRINYPEAGVFDEDRSSVILSDKCVRQYERQMGHPMPYDHRSEGVLRVFPRHAFDYVWMIDPPEFDMGSKPGLDPVWRTKRAVLYRIVHPDSSDNENINRHRAATGG